MIDLHEQAKRLTELRDASAEVILSTIPNGDNATRLISVYSWHRLAAALAHLDGRAGKPL